MERTSSTLIKPFHLQKKYLDSSKIKSLWETLKLAITQIQEQKTSNLSFEELYRCCYTLVLYDQGEIIYEGLKNLLSSYSIKSFEKLKNCSHDEYIVIFSQVWKMYSTSLTMIRDILASLDRVYLEDNAELLSVYDLGLKTFYSEGAQFLSQLRQHLLEQITLERTGIAINRVVMKELLTMLVQLSSVQEFLYDEIFENEYLLSSKEYFQTESVSFITSHNVLSYLKKADVWFQEELERATEYMDSKTAAKVSRVMEETILISHFATLTEAANSTELHSWLDKHMVEELRLLYNLFSRDARGRQKLVEILSSHLNCAGAKFIENHRRGDALAYVQYFLDLKNKYDAILKECFGSDLELEAVYNQSFRCMLNSNSLFPKYFPYHINHLLQHTLMGRTEEEVERSLKKILKVLRFIEDKDIFEKYYRETLAKRLLADKLYSMEAEKFIILEIKHEFGYHFVYKLEGLLKDLIISNEIASKYRNAHILDFGLSVKVLTKSYWSIGSQSPIILHPLLEKARVSFDAFYQKDYPRRRLMWNFALGSVHLRVRFSFKIEKVLVVTPPQLNLLLAFEAKDNVSFKELAKIVGSDQVAREVLPSLCSRKFPILLERNVTNEKIFVFNTALSCAKRKVSLLKLARNNSDEHVKESSDIARNRLLCIEAAIMRVLKTRKTLEHTHLVSQVAAQITSHRPSDELIKRCIASLIERKYISCDPQRPDMYIYVA